MLSGIYFGHSFALTILTTPIIILCMVSILIGFFLSRKSPNTFSISLMIGGCFGLLLFSISAKNNYFESHKNAVREEGYKIIHEYSGFSEKSMPDTSHCKDENTVKYLDANFYEVPGIDSAYIVICK